MIYNDNALGAKPLYQVMSSGVYTCCHSPHMRKQLDMGLMYRVKVRNSRDRRTHLYAELQQLSIFIHP